MDAGSCIAKEARQEIAPGRIGEIDCDDDIPDFTAVRFHSREYSKNREIIFVKICPGLDC